MLDYRLAHGPSHDIAFEQLPPISLGWVTDMWLDEDEARVLQRELRAIVARHAGQRTGPQRFIMRRALAPLLEPDIVSIQHAPGPPRG